jgi:hypothetical protein
MSGEKDLQQLLAKMKPVLRKEEFVYCPVPPGSSDWVSLNPIGWFREEEAVTLILEKEAARQARLPFEFPCRLITLGVHSNLNAVGLLATVCSKLAAEGISVNVISAYYHDHLFVPWEKGETALGILNSLAESMAPRF